VTGAREMLPTLLNKRI